MFMIFSDVRVKDINVILHYTPQNMKFSTKNRHDHIIGIQLSGNANHFFDDHQFTLSENCIYFFNQKEDYKVEVTDKGICFSIHFTTYKPIEEKSFAIKIKDNSAILRILNTIEQQFIKSGECTAKCLSDLYKLFSLFEEIYYKKYSSDNMKIMNAKEYMCLHFKEDHCIAKAAEEYGISTRRFNDVFKQNFHITPNRYLVNCKIDLAKKLLCFNELSIGEISNLCGFDDIYYFSKTFKKITGQTASEYRNKL